MTEMSPAEAIFFAALEKAEPRDRAAYLDAACGTDSELRRRVDRLLAAHPRVGEFLDEQAGVALTGALVQPPPSRHEPDVHDTERPGAMLAGRYKLLEQIGEGGFGVVYLAEQTEPVKRVVALKLIKAGMDSKQVIARFEAERQALALMDHPNIAKVLDGGMTGVRSQGSGIRKKESGVRDQESANLTPDPCLLTPDAGRPYFVMELVKGIPITDYCDQCSLTTRERLDLFLSVCHAVQHAHQKGVIHRDIKPSNVLVAMQDDPSPPGRGAGVRATVKIIDFGVAKAINQRLSEHTLQTGFHQMIGTPMYMSPEQAEMSPLEVDTRADIYSLGVLLYQLLTGTTPFEKERLHQASYDELRRIIREEEPPRPSVRLSELNSPHAPREEPGSVKLSSPHAPREESGSVTRSVTTTLASVAAQRRTEPRHLLRTVKGELDWIVMKALEKDRNRRYETANGFAMDVQRYLADEPVQACPPSKWYRFRKFARRNKAVLGIAGLILFLLVLLGGGGGWVVHDRITQREAAEAMVLEALAQAEPRLQEGNPSAPDLVTAAHKAEAQLASGVIRPELRQRVEQLRADLEMLIRLESVRVDVAARVKEGGHDHAWEDSAYTQAFRDYGIDLDVLSSQNAVARIKKQVICVHLTAAIDDWAPSRRANRDEGDQSWKRLLAVAREADPDPWRLQLRDLLALRDAKGVEQLAAAAPIETLPATTLALLGLIMRQGGVGPAVDFLRQAQRRYPADFWINHHLGSALQEMASPQLEEAIGFHRAALAARPGSPPAHFTLGRALVANDKLDEAIAQYRQALLLKPDYAEAHFNLGNALAKKPGCLDEAIAAYREAIHHKLPGPADAYYNLGNALMAQKRLNDAIDAYEEATRLDANHHKAFFNLGNALRDSKRLDEAVTAFEKSIHLKESPESHTNLGAVLGRQGKLDEAIREFKEAIRLKPDHVAAHSNLGYALVQHGQLEAAIDAYRQVTKLRPNDLDARFKLAETHYNLGLTFSDKGQTDEAIAEYREVLRLKPDDPEAHCNLGSELQKKGQFAEALPARRRGHELGSKQPGWRYPSAKWVQEAERLVELDARLAKILARKASPASAKERVELAWLCQHEYKRLYVAATRFYEEAFAAEPKLADNLKTAHRYNAACAAALAGCGQGQDAKALDDQERGRLRRQALSWLRGDLEAWRQQLDKEPDNARLLVQQQMQHWQQDSDFAGVRDSKALAQLPEGERFKWQVLWAEVDTLRRSAAGTKSEPRANR